MKKLIFLKFYFGRVKLKGKRKFYMNNYILLYMYYEIENARHYLSNIKTDFVWCLFRLSSLEMILWDRFGLPVVIPFDVTSGNSLCPEHCPANWRAYEEMYSLPLRQGKTKNSKNYHHIQ